ATGPPKKGAKTGGGRPTKASGPGIARSGSRGKRPLPRTAKPSNARVVWPPQERTETTLDAIEQMMSEAGLARRFEHAVEREARAAAKRAWLEAETHPGTRRDLRDLPTFTVDPATARDFDDAISAERLGSDPTHPTVRVW